jgi:hypothetical protein
VGSQEEFVDIVRRELGSEAQIRAAGSKLYFANVGEAG